jgi:hypothetical protein
VSYKTQARRGRTNCAECGATVNKGKKLCTLCSARRATTSHRDKYAAKKRPGDG